MVLSKRERYIAIGTTAALAILLLDKLALSPLIDAASATAKQRDLLSSQLQDAQAMIAKKGRLAPKWAEMTQTGMKGNPADAESQILHNIQVWAEGSGMREMQYTPNRTMEKSPLPEINFKVNGIGTLRSAALLMWKVQTANVPIKIKSMAVTARKEGMDDLAFQFNISTVYTPSGAVPATAPSSTPTTGGR